MSFSKRYFSKEKIIKKAQDSTFNDFDIWMWKPDACIFEDESSEVMWKEYMEAGEREQYHLYLKIRK